MSKPDNRADNVAHLQKHIDNTVANLHEAENYLDVHTDEITDGKKRQIESQNERREESIKGFSAKMNHETQQ
ncbi:small acid-soluble spore protein Tlp [Desulfosporosinus fructosivorans]|uniref:Small acid-soluble spore protein Tlp n=1 Tax=Desulfosporosinus fructosivorans TaxID=2018669 RepID=A0A4Z0R6K4_9FIRM|nr:small acid-soluble spore protein Tlp [Desulfosporosinus fructosivorans]TGE38184.1 small acid-soluble spore protein Tlp [Desulfosporosinus fructosivorans]